MQPKIYTANQHHISRDQIDTDALSVLRRLKEAGYTAYAVGGCVRDLYFKKRPKDFDIATSARPEQVKKLFRSCLLIGRRFRLAHIRFANQHVIEVATFRSGDTDSSDLIVRDNTWGTEGEDALRRDFTINGLFYDPDNETIIDYVEGFADLEKKLLRTIGDPSARFMQDPVRMLRLIKFQARFDLTVEKQCQESFCTCLGAIQQSSKARILEELFRMLESGASKQFFELASTSGILDYLLPDLSKFLRGRSKKRITNYLEAADYLIRNSDFKPSREVLFASLIYPTLEWSLQKQLEKQTEKTALSPNEIFNTIQIATLPFVESFIHFPKRSKSTLYYILQYQFRLVPIGMTTPMKKTRFLAYSEFQTVLDFLQIRATVKPRLKATLKQWQERFDSVESFVKPKGKSGYIPRKRHSKSKYRKFKSSGESSA